MRESSNPVLRSLPKQQGGYAQFGTGIAGATQVGYQAQPYTSAPPQAGVSRPLTIDDVVTKTGITLGVLSVTAVISYFLVSTNVALAMPLTLIGSLGGPAIANTIGLTAALMLFALLRFLTGVFILKWG